MNETEFVLDRSVLKKKSSTTSKLPAVKCNKFRKIDPTRNAMR